MIAYTLKLLISNTRISVHMWLVMLRIALPITIVVKVLDDQFNFTTAVGQYLAPVMELVGLPGDTGIAWAIGMFTHTVAGFVVIASQWQQLDLTVAQATVFALLMLQAHSLPIEGRIAQHLGVSIIVSLVVRIGSALLLGWIFYRLSWAFDWLQQPAQLLFVPEVDADNSWRAWLIEQALVWGSLFPLLLIINIFLALLRDWHAEQFFQKLLAPVLRIAGIGDKAGTMVTIGTFLGLTVGGALLINEAKSGKIERRDAFMCGILLCCCHSLIDDALFAAFFGADLAAAIVFRLIMVLIIMALIARLIGMLPAASVERWLMARIGARTARDTA